MSDTRKFALVAVLSMLHVLGPVWLVLPLGRILFEYSPFLVIMIGFLIIQTYFFLEIIAYLNT